MDKNTIDLFEKNKPIGHYSKGVPSLPKEIISWQDNYNEAAMWIMKNSYIPTLLLDLEIPFHEMLAESVANDEYYVKHRGNRSPGWYSMAIHGTAVNHTQPAEYYYKKNKPPYSWTNLAEKCPITKDWLKSLEFESFSRVRFMKLSPGGWIEPHQDTHISGIQAWNVALNHPPGHEFVMDNCGLVPWQEGQVRGIDISYLHSVRNLGKKDRIHIIIHGSIGDKFKKLICKSYLDLYEKTY